MPTVNVREAAMEKSGLNGKTDGDAIRRELYERTISKLRADPNEESEQAPMDSVLIEKIVDYCKKSLGLSELLAGLNYPGVAYGLMIWEQALSNTPSAVEYLLKIAELFSDNKIYRQSSQLFIRAIEVSAGFGRVGPAEDFDIMEIRSPVAYQAKLGMSVNVLLQQSLTTADKKQQVERLFSNIPLADLKPSHQAVLDYVNGTVSDTMSHLPEYATLLGRLLTESSRFGDAIFVLEKALVANHAVDSKPINQIRHQLALVRSLEQLEQRKSVILHNNLTALLST